MRNAELDMVLEWIPQYYDAEKARVLRTSFRVFKKVALDHGITSVEQMTSKLDILGGGLNGLSDATVKTYKSRVLAVLKDYAGKDIIKKRDKQMPRNIPISTGPFYFSHPEGMTANDAKRVYLHLLSLCADFDPSEWKY